MKSLAIAIAALLVVAPAAAAKSGIELDSVPDGLRAGQPWVVSLTAIRHDRRANLSDAATPAVEIDKEGSKAAARFLACPQRDGSYRARVVFPSSGAWTYRVSGLGSLGAHQTWPPVAIRPAASGSSEGKASSIGITDPSRGGTGPGGGDGFPFGWIAAASPIVIALGLLIERRRGRRSGAAAPRLRSSD